MWSATKTHSHTRKRDTQRGFTIVELLIVIIVIGILAAITLVAYNGIQNRARLATLQSDLKNAATTLENDNTTNGAYPASAAAANSGNGLRASTGTTYQYTYTSAGNSYGLTGTNNNVAYRVSTANPTPTLGVFPGHTAPIAGGGGGGSGPVNGGNVTTLAGSGTAGFANGTGASAQFNSPYGIAVDTSGALYVAEYSNHRIRKITPAGVVTTLAGSGVSGYADGPGTSAQFSFPYGIAVDTAGMVYLADTNNSRIRKITPAGVVTTLAGSGAGGFADGTGTSAVFNYASGIAVDSAGTVYVADNDNHRIRKITPAGVVTTLAGSGLGVFSDGTGASAQFRLPYGITVDSAGIVYVADTANGRIRKITPTGVVTTLAGSDTIGFADGTGASAQFDGPLSLATDTSGNIYVADTSNHRIRKITPAGVVTTIAGSGVFGFANGTGTSAQFNWPYGVTVDSAGAVYVTDTDNHRVRKIQ